MGEDDPFEQLTRRVIIQRVLTELHREGKLGMALELKGLKTNIRNLASRVDRLNQKAVAADEKGARLEDHLGDIDKQFADHVDDIEFAANVLGNSANGSSVSGEPVGSVFIPAAAEGHPPLKTSPEVPQPGTPLLGEKA